MDSRSHLEILLGLEPGQDFPAWDLLKEFDRREKRKNSAPRKEANRRAHRHSLGAKKSSQRYHHDVVSPRRRTTRAWMKEHPNEVEEIRRKHEDKSAVKQLANL